MKSHLLYNFSMADIQDEDFAALYESRRRDASFACVYETSDGWVALRDHLGIVPLYYRRVNGEWRFSLSQADLITPQDKLDETGLRVYLATGTSKIHPLTAGIQIIPPGCVIKINRETGQQQIVYRYSWQHSPLPQRGGLHNYLEEAEHYFRQAMQRLIQSDRAVLFLSGGIDSALIGLMLQQAGVQIDAVTSAPWGKSSSEIPYAESNARLIAASTHHVDYLEPEYYAAALDDIARAYPSLHGTRAAVSIVRLWSQMPETRQVFFGQNLDTLTCSMRLQSVLYVAHFFPQFLRERLGVRGADLVSQYLNLLTRGVVMLDHWEQTNLAGMDWQQYGALPLLTLFGMLFAHTPSDSDLVTQLAQAQGIPASSPYYDVDLIEFNMRVPIWQRLTFSRQAPFLEIEKRLHRMLALKFLPPEIVYRKKALTVPFEHHPATQALAASFPQEFAGVALKTLDQRFAAEILRRWSQHRGYANFLSQLS